MVITRQGSPMKVQAAVQLCTASAVHNTQAEWHQALARSNAPFNTMRPTIRLRTCVACAWRMRRTRAYVRPVAHAADDVSLPLACAAQEVPLAHTHTHIPAHQHHTLHANTLHVPMLFLQCIRYVTRRRPT